MPIRPENKDRYPVNWKEIRAAVLKRAGNRCERCQVKNYAVGWRDRGGDFFPWSSYNVRTRFVEKKSIKIVLTIAHLDHQPENNDMANLAALCQRCHNRHDIAHRVRGRRRRLRNELEQSQTTLALSNGQTETGRQ
jgi:5-methylcytosine-specific restriction endonuclease McrA